MKAEEFLIDQIKNIRAQSITYMDIKYIKWENVSELLESFASQQNKELVEFVEKAQKFIDDNYDQLKGFIPRQDARILSMKAGAILESLDDNKDKTELK